jgi:two-component system, OmpR family, KDP operon response regulator KdpE
MSLISDKYNSNMASENLILVIDDEVQIRRLLEITLGVNGYKICEAATGKDGIIAAATHNPALVLLDLGLPDEDGQAVLKKLREWYENPVIILSVRSTEEDIVKALDNGANDYITKPFRTRELLARIRTALRSMQGNETGALLTFQSLTIDLVNHLAKKDGEILKLTSTEFSLLAVLAKNPGKVLTHQYLLKEVWGHGYIGQTQYLRVFIAQLRKKIEPDSSKPVFIITEPAIGYRFFE